MLPCESVKQVSGPAFLVASEVAQDIANDVSIRCAFRVPSRWRSPVVCNPHAFEAEHQVLAWLESLGCSDAELRRARKFDAAGYLGIPFPTLPLNQAVSVGKFLSLWLLWDDVHVESLEDRWRIYPEHILSGRRPTGMTRFDEGWWQLLSELAESRSPTWMRDLCYSMLTWNAAAVDEALAVRRYQENGVVPDFDVQMDLRGATIGMYPTIHLLEDVYDVELPAAFHANPAVQRIKRLANKLVGIGNDIFSFGKDYSENRINLVSTLMHYEGISASDAIEHLVSIHDESIEEFDLLASTLGTGNPEVDGLIERWLQDIRYASVGFSVWEAQAPRYTAYRKVDGEEILSPGFFYIPASSS